ncbi:hypothetical protein KIL84_022191 [Mauremys mutica]|uniref:Uncharacterized protein n=1 Tax=Mauremys mutica TaxID=74926 RepID=A0A9D3XAR7_9SAUR|nr:hypothetical protein KIL84_022135 [Mauremys mutica]KAH1175666.1 hypothetical protein KIL84_022191 [Mauremys mutica]
MQAQLQSGAQPQNSGEELGWKGLAVRGKRCPSYGVVERLRWETFLGEHMPYRGIPFLAAWIRKPGSSYREAQREACSQGRLNELLWGESELADPLPTAKTS